MGSSLGTVFANIIMTDLERVIAEPLITSGEIRLYIRYVNDNLLLAKEEDNLFIFDKFISFHKNLKLTIDRFDDKNKHFWGITIDKNKADYTTNSLILVNILKLTKMFHEIIKFHGFNRFTTEQEKSVHQAELLHVIPS